MKISRRIAYLYFIIISSITIGSAQDFTAINDSIIKISYSNPERALEAIENVLEQAYYLNGDAIERSKYDLLYLRILNDNNAPASEDSIYREFINRYKEENIDSFDVAGFYNSLGVYFYQQGELDSATKYYVLSSENLPDKLNNKRYVVVLNNISGIHKRNRDYTAASKYMKEALQISFNVKDSLYITVCASNLAGSLKSEGLIDSSKNYAEIALDYATRIGNMRFKLASMVSLASTRLSYDKDTLQAITDLEEVYNHDGGSGFDVYKYKAAQLLSQALSDKKMKLKYAKEAYSYYQEDYALLQEEAAEVLVDMLAENNETEEALALLQNIYNNKDSLLTADFAATRMDLLAKYETAEKEAEIANRNAELTASKLFNSRLLLTLIIMTLLVALLFAYMLNRRQKDRLVQEETEKRLAQLETRVLRSQMSPHFIFNSLNSIRYLFMKDQKDKGIKYITKFAKLLRSILNHGEHALVNLEEEVSLTELYIDLEQLRFGDKFNLTVQYDGDDWKSIQIPPFVIQPVVENSFWHGLSSSSNPDKRLHLQIQPRDRSHIITIEDNGVGLGNSQHSMDEDVGKKKSYGISLIKERFELINASQKNHYDIQISDARSFEKGTLVEITISTDT